jgi:hypothetical protein
MPKTFQKFVSNLIRVEHQKLVLTVESGILHHVSASVDDGGCVHAVYNIGFPVTFQFQFLSGDKPKRVTAQKKSVERQQYVSIFWIVHIDFLFVWFFKT